MRVTFAVRSTHGRCHARVNLFPCALCLSCFQRRRCAAGPCSCQRNRDAAGRGARRQDRVTGETARRGERVSLRQLPAHLSSGRYLPRDLAVSSSFLPCTPARGACEPAVRQCSPSHLPVAPYEWPSPLSCTPTLCSRPAVPQPSFLPRFPLEFHSTHSTALHLNYDLYTQVE